MKSTLLFAALVSTSLAQQPVITSPAADLTLTQSAGAQEVQTIDFTNPDSSAPLPWEIVFEGEAIDPLERVLDELEDSPEALLSLLPERNEFQGGESGNQVDLGDGTRIFGNQIRLNDTRINYANFAPNTVTVGEGTARYATAKLPGLFVFTGELEGITDFQIGGSRDDEPGVEVSVDEFTLEVGETTWRAFIKTVRDDSTPVFRTRMPSINQMVLVPETHGLASSFDPENDSLGPAVTNLPDSTTLHYLYFSRPAGASYDLSVFEALASTFLQQILPGPTWCQPARTSGTIPAGDSSRLDLQLKADLATIGSQSSRFAIVKAGTDPDTLDPSAWTSVNLIVTEVGFQLPSEPLRLTTLEGSETPAAEFEVRPAAGETTVPPLTVTSSVGWLSATPLPDQRWEVTGQTNGLDPGAYLAHLTFTDGEHTRQVGVQVEVASRNPIALMADPLRPRLYALSKNGPEPGFLVAHDTGTQSETGFIELGRGPADFAFNQSASELFVLNSGDPSISRVDLDTLTVTETIPLEVFTRTRGRYDARIAAGPGSILYYTDEATIPTVHVFDPDSRSLLQSFQVESLPDGNTNINHNFGDLRFSEEGNQLFAWIGGNSGGFGGNNYLSRFSVSEDGSLSEFVAERLSGYTFSNRGFDDLPILFSKVQDGVIFGRSLRDRNDLANEITRLPRDAYSLSPGGELVGFNNGVYLMSEERIEETGGYPPNHFTPDYTWFTSIGDTSEVLWTDLREIVALSELDLVFAPADGGGVVLPGALRWPPAREARNYQIYLGTDPALVAAADSGSPEFLGTYSGYSTSLPEDLETGRTYHWKVVPNFGSTSEFEEVRSLTVLPVELERESVEMTTVAGAARRIEQFAIEADSGVTWQLSTSESWISLENATGTGTGSTTIVIDASELAEESYRGELLLTVDGNVLPIQVSLTVFARQVRDLEALPDEETIWVSSQGGDEPAFLLAYDIAAEGFGRVIPTDLGAQSKLAVHHQENRIYVAQADPAIIHGYDLTTLEQVFSHALAEESDPGLITGISAGTEGRLILEILTPDQSPEPRSTSIQLIDTASGDLLDEFEFGAIPSGSGVSTRDGLTYYYGGSKPDQVGISHFDLSGDQFVEVASNSYLSTISGIPNILLSADGTRITWAGGIFDPDLNLLGEVQDRLFAISGDGTFAASGRDLYNTANGLLVGRLPVNTAGQRFDGSGEVLYSFDREVIATRLSDFVVLPDEDVVPGMTNVTTVTLGEVALSWEPEATALSYDVYFGTDRNQVATADRSSSNFLGEVTDPEWDGPLPGIALGGTYFWRIDMNGVDQTRTGSVLEFTVASIEATPAQVILPVLIDQPIEQQSIGVESTTGEAWTAAASDPWIVLDAETGTLSEELTFTIDSQSLPLGTHVGSITITSGEEMIEVPIEVDLVEADFVRFLVDPNRSRIYGLNFNARFNFEDWNHLMAINPETAEIEEVIRVGKNVTDLVIDPVTDRLIVTNHQYSVTRVFDLATFTELPPLELGTDVYTLEIDPERRRLITETERADVIVRILDLDTLTQAGAFSARAGVAKYDPAHQIYYRARNFSGASDLERYDLSSDPPIRETLPVRYGASVPNFLITPDGSRLVARDTVFAPDFETVNVLPREALDLSPEGELAVSSKGLHWLDDPWFTKDLPFPADVAAFAADGNRLLLFNRDEKRLESIPLDSLIELPGPTPRDERWLDESPSELAWPTVEGADSYTINLSSPLQGSFTFDGLTAPRLSLPVVFGPGAYVTWSVTAEFPDRDPVTSPDYRFGVRIPRNSTLEESVPRSPAFGPKHLISVSRLPASREGYGLRSFDPATGDTQMLELNPVRRNASNPQFTLIDRFRAYHALPTQTLFDEDNPTGGLNSIGEIYSFDVNAYDRARTTRVPRPPGRVLDFGRGMAASGGLLLVSGRFPGNTEHQVMAYVTEPEFAPVQMFRHSEEREFDRFGTSIALHGNTAALSSNGVANSPNGPLPPAIFIYERDPATGLWEEGQKLEVPTPGISVSQMSDRFLIARSGSTNEVLIYQKAGDGTWFFLTTLTREPDTTGSPIQQNTFGAGIALVGNRLFISDPQARIDAEEGAVFSFIFDGEEWQEGVPILPPDPSVRREEFGLSLAARDRWLFVGADIANSGAFTDTTGHLFEFAPEANQTPFIQPSSVTQAVSGRPFELLIEAEDSDGNEGLVMEALHLPTWMEFDDLGQGIARLIGTPTGDPGSFTDLQFKVTDPGGATSYEAFRLTLVSETDLPEFTTEPEDLLLSDGQDLLLRAAVEGAGPFTWQWFHNDEAIPGANRPTLAIPETAMEDAGEYRAEVRNVVGSTSSRTALVTLTEAGRDGGPWTASEGSMRRSGFHPARLNRHTFVPVWSQRLPLTQPSQATIADGRIILNGRTPPGSQVAALDLDDGALLWTRNFESDDATPVSIHRNTVYLQESNRSDSLLWALSAADGQPLWEQSWITQSSSYPSPAANDQGVWMGGGYGDGLYGFDLDGTQRFFQELPQTQSFWTPLLSGDRLFSWIDGTLREHDPGNGQLLWSNRGTGSRNFGSGAIRDDRAFISTAAGLFGIDVENQQTLWFQPEVTFVQPAVSGDRVYAISGDRVLSFDGDDGTPGPIFVPPTGEDYAHRQPLILHDHLIVSKETQTFVFDLESTELVQTIEIGGTPSYGDGRLIIAEPDGQIHAWFANEAPEFSEEMPTEVNSGPAAPSFELALSPFVSDPDPEDTLTWAIAGVSRPEIFRTLEVNPETGVVSVVYNPWQSGNSAVALSVTDPAGNTTESTIIFTIPPHLLPSLEAAESFELNRLTGLYEHTITLTNRAAREIAGFDLTISNLPEGSQVYGAGPTIDGAATLQQRRVLAAGAAVTLKFDYFLPIRGTLLDPEFATTIVTEPEDVPVADAPGLVIDRCLMLEDGVLIEFAATPGRLYEVQYSNDNATWKVSPTRLRAGGTRVQWIDRGPPQTDSPPAEKSARFYRVHEISE